MRFFSAIAALLLAMASPALAQAPKGSPPIFKVVTSTEPAKGQILFKELLYKTETRVEKRKVLENGKEFEKTVTVEVMVPFLVTATIDATTSRIITPDGKQLPIDEVWKRIKANSVVVVSGDNNTPDPAFLRALSAETLVIVPAPAKK